MLQAAILITGALTISLLCFQGRPHYWGLVIGLASEPLWVYATVTQGQWGMAILCIWYAVFYVAGILAHLSKRTPS